MRTSQLLLLSAAVSVAGCEREPEPPAAPTAQAAPTSTRESAAPKGSGLSAAWTPQLGDVVAERIVGRLRLRGDLDAPMTGRWDRERQQILITIGGARSKVEQSKETLEKMHSAIVRELKPELARELGHELAETEVSLIYVNRKSGKEIVRFTNGSYLLP